MGQHRSLVYTKQFMDRGRTRFMLLPLGRKLLIESH